MTLSEILKEEKDEIQRDLDNGKFGMICSNEDTFKRYIFEKLNKYNVKIIEAVCDETRLICKNYYNQHTINDSEFCRQLEEIVFKCLVI